MSNFVTKKEKRKMLELIDSILQEKMDLNENIIKIKFFEIRVTHNLSEVETFEFIRLARNKLENLGYNVYLTNAKYQYKGKQYIVQDNELLVAIK